MLIYCCILGGGKYMEVSANSYCQIGSYLFIKERNLLVNVENSNELIIKPILVKVLIVLLKNHGKVVSREG